MENRNVRRLLVSLCLSAALTGSGCARPARLPTGLFSAEDGRRQALGELTCIADGDLAYWAVVDRVPGETTSRPRVVAVVVNARELGVDLRRLKGSYVSVEGSTPPGLSAETEMIELRADAIKEVAGSKLDLSDAYGPAR